MVSPLYAPLRLSFTRSTEMLAFIALAGGSATIASDALMNPFDGVLIPIVNLHCSPDPFHLTTKSSDQATNASTQIRISLICDMCQHGLS